MQNGGLCRTRWTTQPLLPTKAMSISCLIISWGGLPTGQRRASVFPAELHGVRHSGTAWGAAPI